MIPTSNTHHVKNKNTVKCRILILKVSDRLKSPSQFFKGKNQVTQNKTYAYVSTWYSFRYKVLLTHFTFWHSHDSLLDGDKYFRTVPKGKVIYYSERKLKADVLDTHLLKYLILNVTQYRITRLFFGHREATLHFSASTVSFMGPLVNKCPKGEIYIF